MGKGPERTEITTVFDPFQGYNANTIRKRVERLRQHGYSKEPVPESKNVSNRSFTLNALGNQGFTIHKKAFRFATLHCDIVEDDPNAYKPTPCSLVITWPTGKDGLCIVSNYAFSPEVDKFLDSLREIYGHRLLVLSSTPDGEICPPGYGSLLYNKNIAFHTTPGDRTDKGHMSTKGFVRTLPAVHPDQLATMHKVPEITLKKFCERHTKSRISQVKNMPHPLLDANNKDHQRQQDNFKVEQMLVDYDYMPRVKMGIQSAHNAEAARRRQAKQKPLSEEELLTIQNKYLHTMKIIGLHAKPNQLSNHGALMLNKKRGFLYHSKKDNWEWLTATYMEDGRLCSKSLFYIADDGKIMLHTSKKKTCEETFNTMNLEFRRLKKPDFFFGNQRTRPTDLPGDALGRHYERYMKRHPNAFSNIIDEQ